MTTSHNADAVFGSENDSLAGLVQRLGDDLRQLTRRIDDHEDQILDSLEFLAAELDTFRDELDSKPSPGGRTADPGPGYEGCRPSAEPSDPPPVPRRWAAGAILEDWDALVEWVDELRSGYSLPNSYIVPPCWPAHPGVVEEFAALHRAWISAVLTDERESTDASPATSAWHDRWLWPSLQRLRTAAYRIANCTQGHVAEPKLETLTPMDRTYVQYG